MATMKIRRQVIVFDAVDIASESAFWAQLLGGSVIADDAPGARALEAADDLDASEGFQVYADPAGHPYCLCGG